MIPSPEALNTALEVAKTVATWMGAAIPPLLFWIGRLLMQIRDDWRDVKKEIGTEDGKEGIKPELRRLMLWKDDIDKRHDQEDIDAEVDRRVHPPRRKRDRGEPA